MESSSTTAAPPVPPVPIIPRQTRQQARRKSLQDPTLQLRSDDSNRVNLQPASPEIISSLITSLSVISKPAHSLFETETPSMPSPVGEGSFGVDYGAFQTPSNLESEGRDVVLDELAASAPIIRTSKPPSGFSPLTAPKSPKSPKSFNFESSGGIRSFLRSSRPSSRGSVTSSQDDTRSIGNLSIERGRESSTDLQKQQSHESWGKKTGRSQKGLLYMSSKERLRVSESDRRRVSTGAAGSTNGSALSLPGPSSAKPDPFMAETPISEEPGTHGDSTPKDQETIGERGASLDSAAIQRPIPTRESSLRKTSSSNKRALHRSSRSKRDSETGLGESIPENEERDRVHDLSIPKRQHRVRQEPEVEAKKRREDILRADMPHSSQDFSRQDPNIAESKERKDRNAASDIEDGAPFPSVYAGRRRSARSAERRKSGRSTPEIGETLRMKRSSSRLKRLSGAKSPERDSDRVTSPEPNVTYERPRSADSIDDAVESYLCSPRLSQKIRHPQTGRVISFSEVGDAEGSAVFCCVGMGLTRYITAFYDELALTLKLRLITPDRPGVGDSEPYSDGTATPLSWPDDVYAICQALKITKFSILAHSAGAIYALATALRMPQHIRGRIHLLAPWIPPSQLNVFGSSVSTPPTNSIPTSQRILRALPTPFLKAANSSFMTATSSSITSSLPKSKEARRGKRKPTPASARDRRDVTPAMDKENMAEGGEKHKVSQTGAAENMDQIRPSDASFSKKPQDSIIDAALDAAVDKERQTTYDTRLTHAIWDLATTGANPAVDLLVCLERRHTIGFRYVDITRPVVIRHGSRDNRVPVENVKWLGQTMRRCEVRVLDGEGHGLMASANVMGSVLMEISREWEDWMRVTGTHKREAEKDRGRTSRASAR